MHNHNANVNAVQQDLEAGANELVAQEDVPSPADKFRSDARQLITGQYEHAANGLPRLLGVSEQEVNKRLSAAAVKAIEKEVKALGVPQVTETFCEKRPLQRSIQMAFATKGMRACNSITL